MNDTTLVRAALEAARSGAGSVLQTVNATITRAPMSLTGKRHVGEWGVAVAKEGKFTETVTVTTQGFGVKVHSSLANKMTNQNEQVRFLHLDLSFTQINAAACSGILPEIWEVKPMSEATAALLRPPTAQTNLDTKK